MTKSGPPTPLAPSEYEAIEQAMMETARGRWFLAQYAEKSRSKNTQAILDAIAKLEVAVSDTRTLPEGKRIKSDLLDMCKAIERTREEIASLKLPSSDSGDLVDASEELDAIVTATENATHQILQAAEDIQETAWTVREECGRDAAFARIDNDITDIYTACSFQDITGQRIQKVVHILRYLEARIKAMVSIWGLEEEANAVGRPQTPNLLDSPDSMQQDDIDTVICNEAANTTANTESTETLDNEPEQTKNIVDVEPSTASQEELSTRVPSDQAEGEPQASLEESAAPDILQGSVEVNQDLDSSETSDQAPIAEETSTTAEKADPAPTIDEIEGKAQTPLQGQSNSDIREVSGDLSADTSNLETADATDGVEETTTAREAELPQPIADAEWGSQLALQDQSSVNVPQERSESNPDVAHSELPETPHALEETSAAHESTDPTGLVDEAEGLPQTTQQDLVEPETESAALTSESDQIIDPSEGVDAIEEEASHESVQALNTLVRQQASEITEQTDQFASMLEEEVQTLKEESANSEGEQAAPELKTEHETKQDAPASNISEVSPEAQSSPETEALASSLEPDDLILREQAEFSERLEQVDQSLEELSTDIDTPVVEPAEDIIQEEVAAEAPTSSADTPIPSEVQLEQDPALDNSAPENIEKEAAPESPKIEGDEAKTLQEKLNKLASLVTNEHQGDPSQDMADEKKSELSDAFADDKFLDFKPENESGDKQEKQVKHASTEEKSAIAALDDLTSTQKNALFD